MKVYFTGSIVGKNEYLKDYQRIIDILHQQGCEVQSDHIMQSSPSSIRMLKREERLAFHAKLERWIQDCDCVVANVSFPSISVGYEIAMALHQNKPVLVLHALGTKAPNLLADSKNDYVICEAYTQHSLPELIEEFIRYTKSHVEMRFTFFITPRIAAHLTEIAKKKHMPKSVYLRDLLEREIR
ncbi:MAG: nucleoside 2-deoxyribosyltransferase [Candidatus Roizmanbacteria bacterium]|nr:nucleoside 2-deoxyribosyltransferase [Candidatus Roizmanbacteria bacterium]